MTDRLAALRELLAKVEAGEWSQTTVTTTDDDNGPREGAPRKLAAWKAGHYTIIRQDSIYGLFLLKGRRHCGLAVPRLQQAKDAAADDLRALIAQEEGK